MLLRTDSGLLRTKHLVVPAAVTVAFGASTRAAIGIVVELNRQISNLEAELATHFEMHQQGDIRCSRRARRLRSGV